jgi:hypothetical protein
MASNRENPFWNQDLVLAVGLAIAGIGMLQGKLFPAAADLNFAFVERALQWKGLEWWPVLLIISGLVLWVRKTRATKPARAIRSVARTGGSK